MKTVKLGDVTQVVSGSGFPKKYQGKLDNNIPFLKVSDMNLQGNEKSIVNWNNTVTNEELSEMKAKTHPVGTVIFPKIGAAIATNKKRILTQESAFDNNVMGLVPDEGYINSSYLYLWLSGRNLSDWASDSELPSMRKSIVELEEIPLPSLEEQRRVVERLDAAFEKIDRAIELTEKNIKNTDLLFGSILLDAVKRYTDVEDKNIGEIADIEYGLTEKSKISGDYRLVRITDIDENGHLKAGDEVFVDNSQRSKKYILNKSDLVVARTGATYGKVLYFDSEQLSVFASYLIRIKFKQKIHPKLFWYYAKTPQYWSQANALAGGTAQPQFNGGALKQILFTYPRNIEEQTAIVDKLDLQYEAVNDVRHKYRQKLHRLHTLKQSLLTQAFSKDEVN